MTVGAHIRTMYGEELAADLNMLQTPGGAVGCWAVHVVGFGHVVIVRNVVDDLAAVPAPPFRAVLAGPPTVGSNGVIDHPMPLKRAVKVTDAGVVEVEVLPNPSGEDRLVVCLTGVFDD